MLSLLLSTLQQMLSSPLEQLLSKNIIYIMSDTEHTEQPVEQITSEPKEIKKTKDPKKVAAGKRLAEYHKKAKEALKNKEEPAAETSSSWMPEISLTTALSIVGITLTAVDLYFRWQKDKEPSKAPVEPIKASKIPVPVERPKFGMD